MTVNKARLAAIGVSVGALVLGGVAAAAFAASTPSPSTTQSAPGSDGGRGGHGSGGSKDTPVTGDEATKVKDAVKAKDSAATITEVRKDPDGSYDALGTKNGAPVFFDVSKDLKTVTERTGGPGGKGGRGMGNHTEVTGSEATKVGDAVKAKDSAVTVTKVLKDEDGSYDVAGTKAGAPVFFEVSKDLKTVTERTGGPGRGTGHGPRGGQDGDQGAPGQAPSAPSTSPSTSASNTSLSA